MSGFFIPVPTIPIPHHLDRCSKSQRSLAIWQRTVGSTRNGRLGSEWTNARSELCRGGQRTRVGKACRSMYRNLSTISNSSFHRYKWRTTNCAEKHGYFCSDRVPNCPQGYYYSRNLQNQPGIANKCFKLSQVGGYFTSADNISRWKASLVSLSDAINLSSYFSHDHRTHVSNADTDCARDNSRLFVPSYEPLIRGIVQWVATHNWLPQDWHNRVSSVWGKESCARRKCLPTLKNYSTKQFQFWLGLRGTNHLMYDHIQNTSLVTAREWVKLQNVSCFPITFLSFYCSLLLLSYTVLPDLPVATEIDSNCYTLRIDVNLTYTINSTVCGQEKTNGEDVYGICEYADCQTTGDEYCIFPFR